MEHRDSVYRIVGTFDGEERIIGAMKRIQAQGREGIRQTKDGEREERTRVDRTVSGFNRLINTAEGFNRFQRESRYIWREQISGMRDFTEEAGKLLTAQARFKGLNLSPEQTTRGLQAVREVARQIQGVRLDDLTQSMSDLVAATGSLDHAIEVLPLAAKTQYVSRALFGESPQKTVQEILATVKALEQLGAVKLGPGGKMDMARFKEYYDTVIKIKAFTGGRIGGRELQQFAATSGLAGMGLTPTGLRNLTYIMQEMGGFKTGTALMSQMQSFTAFRQGAGGQRSFENLARLGLIDLQRVRRLGLAEFTREGRIKRLRPGAMPAADLLQGDPLKFAEVMRDALQKRGKAVLGHEVDVTNAKDVGAALSQITGSRTAMNELGKLIVQYEQVKKDSEMAFKAQGLDDLSKTADEATGKLIKFEAAIDNLKMEAGTPLIQALGSAATAALPLVEVATEHPKLTLFALALGRIGVGSLQTAVALRTSGLVSSIRAVGTEVRGVSTSIQQAGPAVESKARGLGRQIGSALTFTIGATIAGFAIEKTIGGLLDRAEGEIESRKAGFEIQDLEKQKEKLQRKMYTFTGTSTTQDEIAEIDRKIGELKARQGGIGRSGEFFGGKDFSVALAQIVRGPMGAMLHGETGYYGLTRSWNDQVTQSEKERREAFKQTYIPQFDSSTQVSSWLEAIRTSGRYTEAQLAALSVLTYEKYPNFMRQLDLNSEALIKSQGALSGFNSILGRFAPQPKGGQPAPGFKYFPPMIDLPSKATGGFVERGGLVRIHSGEAILPAEVTRTLYEHGPVLPFNLSDLTRGRDGSSPHNTVNLEMNVHFHGPAGEAEVRNAKAALHSEMRSAAKEILRVLEDKYRERVAAA